MLRPLFACDIYVSQNALLFNCLTDAVILLWDSDVSDVDEFRRSASYVAQLRANYTTTLKSVIKTVLQTGAFFAFGGPVLLGESYTTYLAVLPKFRNKFQMLNDYRDMNKAVAKELNVPYIDVREAFLNAIPTYWHFLHGYVTIDGEHENERGTQMVAKMLADALRPWLRSL